MPPKQAPEAPARKVKIDGRVKFTVRTQDPKPCELTDRDRYALEFIHRRSGMGASVKDSMEKSSPHHLSPPSNTWRGFYLV